MQAKKIAIVYDWIDKWGGVERLLLSLHEQFPEADFFTSYYDSSKATWAKDLSIKTSFIQKLPLIRSSRLLSLYLYPLAFETFDLSNYDLVISVTSSFAKGVITRPETKHLCYLLTPTRYFWGQSELYMNAPIKKLGSILSGRYLRQWDFIAAQRVDKIISISNLVKERCLKYYERESEVLYPPFDISYWEKVKKDVKEDLFVTVPSDTFYLLVSRLEPYKKVEYVIGEFNKLKDKSLVIVGTGSEEKMLKQLAGNNITFLKYLSDSELASLYTHAQALIMPQEEDFGYVAIEAQYFGCPVISYAFSGASEIIGENKTGMLFYDYESDSLTKVISEFDIIFSKLKQNTLECGSKLREKFAKEQFTKQLTGIINSL